MTAVADRNGTRWSRRSSVAAAATLPGVWIALAAASRLAPVDAVNGTVGGAGPSLPLLLLSTAAALVAAAFSARGLRDDGPLVVWSMTFIPTMIVMVMPRDAAYHRQLLIVLAGFVTAHLAWLAAAWPGGPRAAARGLLVVGGIAVFGVPCLLLAVLATRITTSSSFGIVIALTVEHLSVMTMSCMLTEPKATSRRS